MSTLKEKTEAFGRILEIMDELRAKCPWDMKQTMESLRHLTLEEVYELSDSILEKNTDEIKKELGDIILHMVFYAKIASEQNQFDIVDVLNSLSEKLIHRHPHIYGDVKVANDEEVSRNWEQLKLKEGKTSVLQGVPVSLPALVKAMRVQEKARAAGFDWEKPEQVWGKVEEELNELHETIIANDQKKKEEEFGDVLFALVNYARFIGVNPEDALERTNKKFISRFRFMEDTINAQGKQLNNMTLDEMDVYWEKAKERERTPNASGDRNS